jgi:hypothetical protein
MRMMLRNILFVVLVLPATGFSQTATFTKNEICYDLGTSQQCFAHGLIETYVQQNNREAIAQSYRAGQQLGQGVGSLAGGLIAVWMRHHAQAVAETKNLQAQLRAYFDAENTLVEEGLKLEIDNSVQLERLRVLDTERAPRWSSAFQESGRIHEAKLKYMADLRKLQDTESKNTHAKALSYFLDSSDGARVRFERQRMMVARDFAFNQLLHALVAWRIQPEGGRK